LGHLVHGTIDIGRLLATVGSRGRGGTAAFIGTVRQSEEDGPVQAIDYSAYEGMAEAEIDRIVEEAARRWPGTEVVLSHRLGRVPVGEASVAAVAAAPHREDAFAACRYVIEETKKRVPVWKKEIFEDGAVRWRENDGG
jgi:molybdopterin synthase catalytic subunit